MVKVLLIDNNDSFTYNIVDYLRRMSELVYDVVRSKDIRIDSIDKYDKIIISPGPGLPKEFPFLFELFKQYLHKKPILGICLGQQALAEYLGGKLLQLHPVVHGQAHAVKVLREDILLNDIPAAFRVGLYHSWAVDPLTLPTELEILALSEKNVIMAVKHKEYQVYGVQFHPESHITDHGFTLLKNFMEL